jgi:uncharacterized repeat protein (TIGR01451 family)/LPXTG-motif cell wall-anchored protein
MGNLITRLRRAPKRIYATLLMAVAVVAVPAGLFAWGPGRATFTEQQPASYVTFNSITNNSFYGDERQFVTVKDASNTATGGWSDKVNVEPGKEYVVRLYVHNNAADNLNLVAENVRASATVPTTTGKSVPISAFVSSSNANPNKVWADVTLNSDKDFNLAYVPGSATFHNNAVGKAPQGVALPDSIVTATGAQLGYEQLDGKMPGCFKYSGYVYFKVKPQFAPEQTPSVSLTKQVRKDGDTTFQKSVDAQPGDTLNYRLNVKNDGQTQLSNVMLSDKLPAGVSLVPGSVKILNANNPNGAYIQDGDKLVAGGVNIGAYTAGSNALVIYKAKVADAAQLACGMNKLTNTATVTPENIPPKSDTADVNVPKDCAPEPKPIQVCDLSSKKVITIDEKDFDAAKHSKNLDDCKAPTPQPVYTCDALGVSKLSDTKFRFETGYTVKGGTFKSVTYIVRDASGKEIARQVVTNGNAWEYTQTAAGTYAVESVVTFTVDGKDVTANGEQCKKSFEVPAPAPGKIQVCDLTSKQVITINEDQYDASKHSKNLDDCKAKTINVCDLNSKQIITIDEKDFDSKKHSKNMDDCAPKTPMCPIPGKEHMPADSKDCVNPVTPAKPTTPVTPSALPKTGADAMGSIIAIGVIVAGLGYAVASRKI